MRTTFRARWWGACPPPINAAVGQETLEKPKLHERWLARLRTHGQPRYMGKRVAHANDLGELLTRTTARPAPERNALIRDAAAPTAARAEGAPIDQDALARAPITDLQKRIAMANDALRKLGHPADRP